MKTFILTSCLLFLTAGAVSAQSGGGCNEGAARGAAMSSTEFRDCIAPYTNAGFGQLGITVEVDPDGLNPCDQIVSAWYGPVCHGPRPCPDFPTRIIAQVRVDENGNVTDVTCY